MDISQIAIHDLMRLVIWSDFGEGWVSTIFHNSSVGPWSGKMLKKYNWVWTRCLLKHFQKLTEFAQFSLRRGRLPASILVWLNFSKHSITTHIDALPTEPLRLRTLCCVWALVAQWVVRPTHTRLVPGSKHAWYKNPLVFAMIAGWTISLAAQCLNWFPLSVLPNTLKGLANWFPSACGWLLSGRASECKINAKPKSRPWLLSKLQTPGAHYILHIVVRNSYNGINAV